MRHAPILASRDARSCVTLPPDAQYCYSRSNMARMLRVLALVLVMGACLVSTAAGNSRPAGASQSPREIYKALNALRVDAAQIYTVNEIRLRRDAVSLIFSEGILGF